MNPDASSPLAPAIAYWLTQNIARLAQLPTTQIDAATPVVDFGIESLALLGLAGDLAAWLNRDVSPTLLWEYPTIAELAAHLDETPATMRKALVALQTQGEAPPFYFVHDITGTLLSHQYLLEHLGQEQMIYGFEVPFNDGEAAQIESVEMLATHYLAELRAHQPCGPYFLGGYSLGGLIAYEMARQLREQEQTIGLLVLFDTLFPGLPRRPPSLPIWIWAHFGRLTKVPRKQLLIYLHRRLQRIAARLKRAPLPAYEINPSEITAPHPPVFRRLREVFTLYRPGVFDGSLVYLKATEKSWTVSNDVAAWRRVVRGLVHTRPIPGHHNNIITAPHAIHVAAQLKKNLRRASTKT